MKQQVQRIIPNYLAIMHGVTGFPSVVYAAFEEPEERPFGSLAEALAKSPIRLTARWLEQEASWQPAPASDKS